MPSIPLPLLLLTLAGVGLHAGLLLPEGREKAGTSPLDDILQRSESLLLQSVLKRAEKEGETKKGRYNTGDIHIVMLAWY